MLLPFAIGGKAHTQLYIEEYHLKKKREREISEAADRLLSLPPMPVPENWEEFEAELGRLHGFHKGQ